MSERKQKKFKVFRLRGSPFCRLRCFSLVCKLKMALERRKPSAEPRAKVTKAKQTRLLGIGFLSVLFCVLRFACLDISPPPPLWVRTISSAQLHNRKRVLQLRSSTRSAFVFKVKLRNTQLSSCQLMTLKVPDKWQSLLSSQLGAGEKKKKKKFALTSSAGEESRGESFRKTRSEEEEILISLSAAFLDAAPRDNLQKKWSEWHQRAPWHFITSLCACLFLFLSLQQQLSNIHWPDDVFPTQCSAASLALRLTRDYRRLPLSSVLPRVWTDKTIRVETWRSRVDGRWLERGSSVLMHMISRV